MFLQPRELLEVEEFDEQVLEIFLLELRQSCDTLLRVLLLVLDVAVHPWVVDDGLHGERCGKHHPFESPAPAEGHIHLPGCEGEVGVDDGRVDARTSDALAMTVRMGAPIFTYKELLEKALIGQDCFIRVEDDLDEFKELKVVTPGVDTLKQQLDEAIQKEDYEKAAELRDQIKQLGNE